MYILNLRILDTRQEGKRAIGRKYFPESDLPFNSSFREYNFDLSPPIQNIWYSAILMQYIRYSIALLEINIHINYFI
jgi:hypothetical protein